MATGRLRRWTVTLHPGETREFVTTEWADALVVVEQGVLVIECCSGRPARFATGSVLTLAGLPARCLRNDGPTAVVLSAVERRATATDD
jgi:hypothetical protein